MTRRRRPSSGHGRSGSATSTSHRCTATGPRSAGSAPSCAIGRATTTSCRRRSAAWSDRPTGSRPVPTSTDRRSMAGPMRSTPGRSGRRIVFDYSADGVLRSLEESLERLGLDRIDVAFIHDPDDHWQAAIEGAYPALHRLREQGVLRAIGAGMNQSAMLARFARETEMDVFLVAGRYTLLDQAALPELLPLCLERGIRVVVGGVMNSGVLVDPGPGARFDYKPAATRSHRPGPSPGGGLRTPRRSAPGGRGPVPAGPPRRRRPRRGGTAGRPPRRVPGPHAPRAPARPVGRPARGRLDPDGRADAGLTIPARTSLGQSRRIGSDSSAASQCRSAIRAGTRSAVARTFRRVMLAAQGPSLAGCRLGTMTP